MTQLRKVTDRLMVSPQISPNEAREAAAAGFVLIINNRPDGEAPDQPPGRDIEIAVRSAGADYLFIPVTGRPTPQQAEAQAKAVAEAKGPVLAFCRSGTRSITTWALGEQASGAMQRQDLVRLARAAGYDLDPILPPDPS
jgi:uncharacterized protein (TIGR01244 family)